MYGINTIETTYSTKETETHAHMHATLHSLFTCWMCRMHSDALVIH